VAVYYYPKLASIFGNSVPCHKSSISASGVVVPPNSLTTERSAARAHDAGIEFGRLRADRLQRFVRRRLSWVRSRMPIKGKDCEERNQPATLTERGRVVIESPRKPNGLSHCIFECLIVEASSQAQNHLSVLADPYTERCRGVFDCTRDG